MKQDELKRTFRDATVTPPLGSRERVWRGLEAPAAPRRQAWLTPVLATAAVLIVGVSLFALRSARTSERTWNDSNSAVLWKSARASLDVPGRHVTLESGEVALSSWGAPLALTAAGHTVRVEAGVAVVRVAGDSVKVDPVDGIVWFDGTSMRATAQSRGAAGPLGQGVLAMESALAQPRRLLARADDFIAERHFVGALETLSAVARLGGLDAEVALSKQGELELRELDRPEAALRTFEAGEARFPNGALTQERKLSAIEACVKLEQWPAVKGRTEAFLAAHAQSERGDEVRLLHATALAATGELSQACAEVARLPTGQGAALRARCP